MIDFSTIAALSFDCYGTLIDWERGLLEVLVPWAERHNAALTEDQLLEAYSAMEPEAEAELPESLYPEILRATHYKLSALLGLPSDPLDADHLAGSVGNWPEFSDTAEALKRLQRRFKLIILSNIDNASFVFSNRLLRVNFDAIITAEDVGAYKPDPRMFDQLLTTIREMGIERDELVHVAQSLYHDHVPAKKVGLQTAWIDRRVGKSGSGATPPVLGDIVPDLTVASMSELADYVEGS